jgi:hypothetical protein
VVGLPDSDIVAPAFVMKTSNPLRDSILQMELSVPFATPASLDVFDVAGRLVKGWSWDALPAGVTRLHWDLHTNRWGGSGVLFVRFHVSGKNMIRKVIVLR